MRRGRSASSAATVRYPSQETIVLPTADEAEKEDQRQIDEAMAQFARKAKKPRVAKPKAGVRKDRVTKDKPLESIPEKKAVTRRIRRVAVA